MASMMSGQAMQGNHIRDLMKMLQAADAGVPIRLLAGKLPVPNVENAPPLPQQPRQLLPPDKPPTPKPVKSVLKKQ